MENLRGITMMVASMALFAVEDTFIKILTAQMPMGQVLVILGVGGAAVFAALTRLSGRRVFTRAMLHPALIARNLGEIFGTLCFVSAIALTPLSTAASILQAMPLVVTMGAAMFLGETVGWRRWTAIGTGFVGVLIILKPGLDGFDANALFAVGGVLGLAVRDLATRAAPPEVSAVQMSTFGFGLIVPPSAILMVATGQDYVAVTPDLALLLSISVVVGVAGYYAIVAAMRQGDVAVVTPFRYSRLLFAMALGIIVFGERPDTATYLGAAVIIGSGLYTLARERARIRPRPA
ncbi:membrane protein [Actibacterium mucosum KCTC 23349]|uniref:Membrane protein n=1 Tax=Actibacterium mucosum KCTC 23349 TaxID=1454373 RepID=A0A037ZKH1_9RHOB|nr:DMT family transporter [Actibacterium mucosum]KAJ56608.1 membrane protein [Actibacterium mucosum KCTC 23349]